MSKINHMENCGVCHQVFCQHTYSKMLEKFNRIISEDENLNAKYVPIDIYCVWAVDDMDGEVRMIGQVPRKDLTENEVDLPDWVELAKEYSSQNIERIYKVKFGTLNEFMNEWFSWIVKKSSIKIAGINIL